MDSHGQNAAAATCQSDSLHTVGINQYVHTVEAFTDIYNVSTLYIDIPIEECLAICLVYQNDLGCPSMIGTRKKRVPRSS